MLFVHRDRIREVTPEDVKRVAEAYFKESNRTVGLFLSTDPPDRAEIPPTPDVLAVVRDYKGREGLSAGEEFDPSPANVDARTIRSTLPVGMKLAAVVLR